MSSGNYNQDFLNISGWTNNYASGTGAENWRVATSVATSIVNTTTVFTSGTSGGIQNGTNSMILLATGTNSTATDLLLDYSGRTVGTISLDWTKVVNTVNDADPRSSDLKIQYSIDNGITFADLTGYTIPRVLNNSTSESGSISGISLPSSLNNQNQVVIRFYAWNNGQTSGSGNRPKIQIDNIYIGILPINNLSIINSSPSSALISWTAPINYNSSSNSILVFIKANSAVTQGTPTNSPTTYTANTTFASGTQYQNDANAYCVYKGDGTSVTVTGLTAGTIYHVLVYNVLDADPFYSLAAIASTQSLWEDCETNSKTGFACGTVTMTSGSWDLCEVLYTTGDANDAKNGTKSMRARTNGSDMGTATMNFDLSNGAQTFSVYHARYGSDANTKWIVEKSVDAGTTWIQVGNEVTSASTTLTLASFTVDEPCPVRFRLKQTDGSTTRRTNWDDITVTNYSGICIKDLYYRSAGDANWTIVANWEVSTDNVSWSVATIVPSATAKTITVQSGHTVTVSTNITVDNLVVDGILTYSGGTISISNGTGTDLTINGTFEDSGPNSISWLNSSTWVFGSTGTLVRTATSTSSNFWQNAYEGGISNIISSSNWILRSNGTSSPSITSADAYYGNLFIECTSGSWTASVASYFNVSSNNPPIIKGNLDIGGNGAGTVIWRDDCQTANKRTRVEGNLIIRSGSRLNNYGNGFEIKGNLQVDGDLYYDADHDRKFLFSGGNSQTISGGGTTVQIYHLEINKTLNNLTLSRAITVDNQLTLTSKNIITTSTNLLTLIDNATSTSGSNSSFVDGPMKKIGNDAFEFPIGKNGRWARIGISAHTLTNTQYTAEYFANGYGNYTLATGPPTLNNVSVLEYWTLDQAVNNDDAMVKLFWEDNSFSSINDCDGTPDDLRVAHWNGSSWEINVDGVNITGGCPTAGNVETNTTQPTYSPFTFGSKNAAVNPLPVEWLDFAGKFNGKEVELNWQTAVEINNDFFEIEKLEGDWKKIGIVKGAGNSSTIKTYNFFDRLSTTNYQLSIIYYRLKQVDYDGKFDYSKIISVKISSRFSIENFYADNEERIIAFFINDDLESHATVEITDVSGRIILNENISNPYGQIFLNCKNISKGLYFFTLKNGEKIFMRKFIFY